jgi:hypothetical protein
VTEPQVTTTDTTETTGEAAFFNDVSGHWAETFINQLHQAGVDGYTDASGNPTHQFVPENKITRAELIVLLMKVKYGVLPEVSVAPYSDVPASHWAAAYIAKAKELGIVTGYADGTFKLDNNATRSEALKMTLLSWVSPETVSSATTNTSCNDVVQSEWYAPYFNYALNSGIVGGYQDVTGASTGFCGPANHVTRAESAKMTVVTQGA